MNFKSVVLGLMVVGLSWAAEAKSSAQACKAASDCKGVLPQSCLVCKDGSDGCAHWACVADKCAIEYCPAVSGGVPGGEQCEKAGDCKGALSPYLISRPRNCSIAQCAGVPRQGWGKRQLRCPNDRGLRARLSLQRALANEIGQRGDMIVTGETILQIVPEGDSQLAAGLLQTGERISAAATEVAPG